jgi:hypothetical protein
VFEQIPGYRLAKAFTGDGPLAEQGGRALRPALAAIEDGQCPALVMDELGTPARLGRSIILWGEARPSSTGNPLTAVSSLPVGRSADFVGLSSATRGYPVGRSGHYY